MRRILVPLLILLLITACGRPAAVSDASSTTEPVTSTTAGWYWPVTVNPAPGNEHLLAGGRIASIPEGMSLAARAKRALDVYESPTAPQPSSTIPVATILGTETVLRVVEGPVDGWVRVLLPLRPNNSTGWIQASEVLLFLVDGRLVVDLSKRTLTYYEGGELVLESPVAIGSSSNPTPQGSFFVTDNVTLSDPTSPWGPYALGLSARSETITEYNGGDGIIGIHGTNRPGSIGQAASLGCVRVPNDVITDLHSMIAVGTPVDIVA